jgi:hypothetical protein
VEDGTAYVEAWAYNQNFYGYFVLYHNGAWVGQSKTQTWVRGGGGWLRDWAAGGGYTMRAVRSDGVVLGQINFRI